MQKENQIKITMDNSALKKIIELFPQVCIFLSSINLGNTF